MITSPVEAAAGRHYARRWERGEEMTATVGEGLHNDEWLSRLSRRLRLTPWRAALLMALINLGVDIPLGLYFDALFTPNEVPRGLFGEPSDWLYEFLIHPLILAYFVWLQTAGKGLFEELAARRIVPQVRLERVTGELRLWLRSRLAPIVSVTAAAAFAIWFTLAFAPTLPFAFLEEAPYASWITRDPLIALVRAPIVFLVFYALVLVIYDLVFIIGALNATFRDETARVDLLDPDRAGGLGFIGRFSRDLTYFIAACGLLLFARIRITVAEPGDIATLLDFSNALNYVFLLGVGAYLLIAPLIFFLPLWAAHVAMVNYRDGLLQPLSEHFNKLITGWQSALTRDDAAAGPLLDEAVKVVEAEEQLVKRAPLWPFNIDILRAFVGITLTPLALAVITIILEILISRSLAP